MNNFLKMPKKNSDSRMSVRSARLREDAKTSVAETLTVEAPLQIKVNEAVFSTTMRTPGNDEFLARGLLFTENIITKVDAPLKFEETQDPETKITAIMDVSVPPHYVQAEVAGKKTLMSTSSCGLCGTRNLEDLQLYGPRIELESSWEPSQRNVAAMMDQMQSEQPLFDRTGGSHAAALFSAEGQLLAAHEDISRHNAVDKAIGELLTRHTLQDAQCLTVSGRTSYEIVFKAYRAAIPHVMSISAVSSMAVETAARFGMTLIGFCRDDTFTIYSSPSKDLRHTIKAR